MFYVQGTTITLSRGDTGSVTIGSTGYTFGSDDRAVFTVRNGAGEAIMEKNYELDDGAFTVQFHNGDTDTLPLGGYNWDVRYIMSPLYSSTETNKAGQPKIVDGAQVITPKLPMTLTILGTVGEV